MQQNKYDKEPLTAVEAQRLAQEIALGLLFFRYHALCLNSEFSSYWPTSAKV